MPRTRFASCLVILLLALSGGPARSAVTKDETVQQAICRLIDQAAKDQGLPVDLFTRLIWRESAFRAQVVSPAGAQGIAQFMPGTAKERGLADPFDPEQAIPESARLMADLVQSFGNFGLAAAAYNAGPTRVQAWLAGTRSLPAETQTYVSLVTSRNAQAWIGIDARERVVPTGDTSCGTVVAALRRGRQDLDLGNATGEFAPVAPWGVQLAGNFSKATALRAFRRAAGTYERAIGPVQPMIIGTRLRSRGSQTFYRVRVPAQTRQQADNLCQKIRSVGGSCAVLAS